MRKRRVDRCRVNSEAGRASKFDRTCSVQSKRASFRCAMSMFRWRSAIGGYAGLCGPRPPSFDGDHDELKSRLYGHDLLSVILVHSGIRSHPDGSLQALSR